MLYIELFGGRLRISLWLIAAYLAVAVFFDAATLFAFVPALVLHEFAHVLVACAFKLHVARMTLLPFGCEAEIQGFDSSYKEAICAAAGPCASLMAACAAVQMPFLSGAEHFMEANMAVAAVNLLPVLPLDGGRILYIGLKNIMRENTARKLLYSFGIGIGSVFTALFAVMAASGEVNITVLMMGAFMALHSASGIKDSPFASYKALGDKRIKSSKGHSLAVKHIAVSEDAPLINAIREFDPGKLNCVYVMKRDLSVCRVIDESAVMEYASLAGTSCSFAELTEREKGGRISYSVPGYSGSCTEEI